MLVATLKQIGIFKQGLVLLTAIFTKMHVFSILWTHDKFSEIYTLLTVEGI